MDKERIKEIIIAQGYKPDLRSVQHHSSRARLPETTIVCAQASNHAVRSLGVIEVVAQMDEEELCNHIAARFAQSDGRKRREVVQAPCAEEERRIRAIIEGFGYLVYTLAVGGTKGNATRTYIYAAKDSVKWCLGNINTIAPMSEDELRAHIEAKFAQGAAQKARR